MTGACAPSQDSLVYEDTCMAQTLIDMHTHVHALTPVCEHVLVCAPTHICVRIHICTYVSQCFWRRIRMRLLVCVAVVEICVIQNDIANPRTHTFTHCMKNCKCDTFGCPRPETEPFTLELVQVEQMGQAPGAGSCLGGQPTGSMQERSGGGAWCVYVSIRSCFSDCEGKQWRCLT